MLRKLLIKIRVINQKIAIKFFDFFEFWGVHILPIGFYYPVPHSKDLTDEIFDNQSKCVGIDWNEKEQIKHIVKIFPKFINEKNFKKNHGLSIADAMILHAMVRHYKPKKIIEIGSGESTKFTAAACELNKKEGNSADLYAIEPYPSQELLNGFKGLTSLIIEKVQNVKIEKIIDCDMLFIDSSHVVKTGSDVNHEILELLPRLKIGALIHWHDILLPGEYWKDWIIGNKLFWTEQYLLQSFLQFNSSFKILWASHYMQLKNPDIIKASIPEFDAHKHRITSFWIRRIQ